MYIKRKLMLMPYGKDDYARCPRCGKVAIGEKEIEQQFGYRTMEAGNVIPQSHCRKCRIEELKNNK